MRIIFLNRFYWPEEPATAQLLTDLATNLAAHGHLVTVISSSPPTSKLPDRATHDGVNVIRLSGTRWGRTLLLGRALDFFCFIVGANLQLAKLARPGDGVVAMTDPPMLGRFIQFTAARRGARCFHWVQDIFPEIAVALLRPRWLRAFAGLLRPGRDRAWRAAAGCVTLGPQMASVIRSAGVAPERVTVIPNWAPRGLSPASPDAVERLKHSWGITANFVVVYSGNLGRAHDFTAVLAIAKRLAGDPEIAFAFIGDGANRLTLEAAVGAEGLANVRFFPAQLRADLSVTLSLGNLHLVTVRAGCEPYVFPSKIYGIAAVGRPVLFIGDPTSDPARLVTEAGFGFAYHPGEVIAMAERIQHLARARAECSALGAAATRFCEKAGRLEHATTAWLQFLDREGSCGARSSEAIL